MTGKRDIYQMTTLELIFSVTHLTFVQKHLSVQHLVFEKESPKGKSVMHRKQR